MIALQKIERHRACSACWSGVLASLDAFDAWLWGVGQRAPAALELAGLAVRAAEDGVRLRQLTP